MIILKQDSIEIYYWFEKSGNCNLLLDKNLFFSDNAVERSTKDIL